MYTELDKLAYKYYLHNIAYFTIYLQIEEFIKMKELYRKFYDKAIIKLRKEKLNTISKYV